MRVLLDTNIIIDRENPKQAAADVAEVFRCLDRLHAEKFIHPSLIKEISKYGKKDEVEILLAKLKAYELIKSPPELPESFLSSVGDEKILKSSNNYVDDEMLFQVFDNRIDALITEDRGIHLKAKALNIRSKVYYIEQFLGFYYKENPELIEYKVLAVKKGYFSDVDIDDAFFDSFRKDYLDFNLWFKTKSNEPAYYCKNEEGKILGFLYLKTETEKESYSHFSSRFLPKKRLKIGTFKVLSSGFRLGERFMKIVFDNAIERNVEEIYVTIFNSREELKTLIDLFLRWGFCINCTNMKTNELVLVKKMKGYVDDQNPMYNFPNLNNERHYWFLPIEQSFHTDLFPDSFLRNENLEDLVSNKAHRYAIQKIYISWAGKKQAASGDLVFIYRNGTPFKAAYTGVISTVCVLDSIVCPQSEEELLFLCKNRSVFTIEQLIKMWRSHREHLMIIKLLFYKTMKSKVILKNLWDNNIVQCPNGPRPFDKIESKNAEKILELANTTL